MRRTAARHRPTSPRSTAGSGKKRWPVHGVVGLALVFIFWAVNWSLDGLRTQWVFFPLWLGYCLTVDALVVWRKGESMVTRNAAGYAALFLASVPGWWLFELLNLRSQNWEYVGAEHFTDVQYFLLCSLSFSTVMPAVFGTAELVGTFAGVQRMEKGPALAVTNGFTRGLFITGWLMLALLWIWPLYFFPFMWISVYFVLDPMNVWAGRRSLLESVARGDWRPAMSLAMGCLVCGFFWEMWNYDSYPKWIYHVPFVDFFRVFEMPLLGYLGYIPFSWELFALYCLLSGKSRVGRSLVQISCTGESRED